MRLSLISLAAILGLTGFDKLLEETFWLTGILSSKMRRNRPRQVVGQEIQAVGDWGRVA